MLVEVGSSPIVPTTYRKCRAAQHGIFFVGIHVRHLLFMIMQERDCERCRVWYVCPQNADGIAHCRFFDQVHVFLRFCAKGCVL